MNQMAINVKELAKQLGISLPKAYELIKTDGFPSVHLGKRIIIPVTALQEWLSNNANCNKQ